MSNPSPRVKQPKTDPDVIQGPVNITLTDKYVVVPFDVYNTLLEVYLSIQKGDYVRKSEMDGRIREGVNRALGALTSTLAQFGGQKGADHGADVDARGDDPAGYTG